MKSPEEGARRLVRQWENADLREGRLLDGENAWPLSFAIGRPPPRLLSTDLDAVKRHIERWRTVKVGAVEWEMTSYRAAAEPVEVPMRWLLHSGEEWIEACRERKVRSEFETLEKLLKGCDPVFHPLLVRRRSLWRERPEVEVMQASRLALELEPGCAAGKPLRALSAAGIDTKFFERNEWLVVALLDVRFDEEVSRIGLEPFLGAISERDHWLLVVDLDGSLLPFAKQRVGSSELKARGLPGESVLIVENEGCYHQLPRLDGTIAVLGAGFDLTWTHASWLAEKKIAYWGDLDTWGLQFLATARCAIPHLDSLLMTSETFERNRRAAVPEPVVAGLDPPAGLEEAEKALYTQLLRESRGRLEQEFLPEEEVWEAVSKWAGASRTHLA